MDFELGYDGWMASLSTPMGLGPKKSVVRIDDGTLHVKMGWGFSADIPLTSIVDAAHDSKKYWSWGVHGWRGSYLVNGSSTGLVKLTIDPRVAARVSGVPVKLRELLISVTEPDAFIAACGPARE